MAVGSVSPFKLMGTLAVSASTTSTSVTLIEPQSDSLLCYNATTGIAVVSLGGTGVVAALATGAVVPPGGSLLLYRGLATQAAVVMLSGSGTVYLTSGDGTQR